MKLLIGAIVIGASLAVAQQQEAQSGNPAGPPVIVVNDHLSISAKNVEGPADALYRVDPDGTVTFPLIGKIRAEGLTVQQFETLLSTHLTAYVRSPEVSVKPLVTRSDTIVVAGAFRNPGIHALSNRRTLLDVISAVGGLESTARTVKITRRIGPGQNTLASSPDGSVASTGTTSVNLAHLAEVPALNDNLVIEPHDVLFAETTVAVFLTGEVLKPGSFDIGEKSSIGLTELISSAGGFAKEAAPQKTKVLRPIPNETRRAEIAVDAKSMLTGRAVDFRILPNDIVIVPRSGGKLRAMRAILRYAGPVAVTSLIFLALR